MIPIPARQFTGAPSSVPKALILGIGNAGVSLVDALTLAGAGDHARLVAVNTDSVSLGASVAPEKILIGQQTTRGLGCGGDPELGAQAAEESEAELLELVADAQLVILCSGLGGGTGSGATPVIADIATRSEAFVLGLATLPFSFEGRRRISQAENSLHDLKQVAGAVITFENDRMSDIAAPMAGVHETFSASDQVLADSMAALLRLIAGAGPMRVSVADLLALFRPGTGTARFGSAAGQGPNRANQAAERVLKSPLLREKNASESAHAVVHIEAASELKFVEVEAAARVLAKAFGDSAVLHLAITTNDELGDALVVTVLANSEPGSAGETPQPQRVAKTAPATAPTRTPPVSRSVPVPPIDDLAPEPEPEPAATSHGDGELFNTEPFTVPKSGGKRTTKAKQETLSLDAVQRGRFDKSEPTIVGGEDLDVPTFLRQKLKLR